MGFWDNVTDPGSWALGGPLGGLANGITGGSIGNGVKKGYNWLTGSPGTQGATDDRALTNQYLQQGNPYINNTSSQNGNYNGLISQLQQSANGEGPSLAGDAYNRASGDAVAAQAAFSHGNNAGAARQAAMNIGGIQQGLAQGYGAARNQEVMGARGQLGQVVQAADQSQLQRDKANQEAWLNMLAQQMGLTRAQLGMPTNMQQIGGLVQAGGNIAKLAG